MARGDGYLDSLTELVAGPILTSVQRLISQVVHARSVLILFA
jgi:hypothetical protein